LLSINPGLTVPEETGGDRWLRGRGLFMLAQVLNVSGTSTVPDETALAKTQPMAEVSRKLDGCEGLYAMTDSASGSGITIILWRDQAAMQAAADHLAADNETIKDLIGVTITAGPVYDTVTSF